MQTLADGLPQVFLAWVFAVGAVVGSFLNVVIARVPNGESIVSPGSRCPRCKKEIRWFDNLPLLSWLILRARCRSCGLPISVRYPLVELLTAVLFVAVIHLYGPTWAGLGYCALSATLVALAYIDLDTWLLPHQMTWPLLALGLASPLWNRDLSFRESWIGAAIGFALFAAIALLGEKVLKRETMGWGDVWLLAGIGGWLGWPALLPVVMLSALQGSVVGLALIAAGKGEPGRAPESTLPAAPGATRPAAPEAALPAAPEAALPAAPAAPEVALPAAPAAPVSEGGAPPPAAPAPNPAAATAPDPGAAAPADALAPTAPEAAAATADEDWVPPKHAVPYGPFLALAAIEYLLVGAVLIDGWTAIVGRLIR